MPSKMKSKLSDTDYADEKIYLSFGKIGKINVGSDGNVEWVTLNFGTLKIHFQTVEFRTGYYHFDRTSLNFGSESYIITVMITTRVQRRHIVILLYNVPPEPSRRTHPNTDELIVQYDPGQQVHAAHVDGEQGQRVGGHEYAERVYVQVIGEHPEHAEHAAPGEKVRGGEPAVPKVAHALAEYVRGRLIVGAAQLTEEVQREKQHRPVRAKPCGEKRRVVRHQLEYYYYYYHLLYIYLF